MSVCGIVLLGLAEKADRSHGVDEIEAGLRLTNRGAGQQEIPGISVHMHDAAHRSLLGG